MTAIDVINLYNQLNNLGSRIWLDGGWAVDALLGKQTRPHADMDIVIQQKDIPNLRKLLIEQGYQDIKRDDTSTWNFVLGDSKGKLVDVHAIIFDKKGNGLYGPVKKGVMYPADSLIGTGTINSQKVNCISAEYLVKFHCGYQIDEKDYQDVITLCAKFNIEIPRKYKISKYT